MNVMSINRLNNEYQALMNQAAAYHEMNGGRASNDEGLCYQQAANICAQLASMSIGSEARHWVGEQQKCQQRMRMIWNELHPRNEEYSSDDEPGQGQEKPENESGKGSGNPADQGLKDKSAERSKIDGIKKEIVESWFKSDPGYGFDKVIGMDEVKTMLMNSVRDDKMRELTEYLGLPTVQSYFFYGPPGCGKTFIIEAFVHELMQQGYSYMSLASADIHSKFSGEADKIVKRVFTEAVDHAPCILFMDEIDGICQSRDLPHISDFNMQLTTTFLTGFNQLAQADRDRKSVIFISATNYPSNVDTAMLDRVELVSVPMPDRQVREMVFRKKLEELVKPDASGGFSWEKLADRTEGYSQRDINRVSQNILKMVYRGVLAQVGTDADAASKAVHSLKEGSFCLKEDLVSEVLSAYKVKPLSEIERSLREFEEKL